MNLCIILTCFISILHLHNFYIRRFQWCCSIQDQKRSSWQLQNLQNWSRFRHHIFGSGLRPWASKGNIFWNLYKSNKYLICWTIDFYHIYQYILGVWDPCRGLWSWYTNSFDVWFGPNNICEECEWSCTSIHNRCFYCEFYGKQIARYWEGDLDQYDRQVCWNSQICPN